MVNEAASRAGLSAPYHLTSEESAALNAIQQGESRTLSRRAAIILARASGAEPVEIAAQVSLTERTVKRWINEFSKRRMDIFPVLPVLVQLPTVDELCQRYHVDIAHAQHVGTLAAELFDLTQTLHGLDAAYRDIIYTGGVLHNIAYAGGRAKHHTRGRDILIENPIAGLDESARKLIAVTTVFHRKKWRAERFEAEPVYQSLSENDQYAARWLAALIRIADGLDYSQSQSTEIGSSQVSRRVRIRVTGPCTEYDALRADTKADLWRAITHTPIIVRPDTESDAEAVASQIVLNHLSAPGVEPDDLMSEAGRKLLGFHFGRMVWNETGTREGVDIEALHDMRVATRRMRVVLRMFGDYYEKSIYKPLWRGLKAAGKALGPARDLDVFMEKTQRYIASLPVERADELQIVQARWRNQRDKAQQCLVDYLENGGYRSFVDEMAEFVSTPGLGSADLDMARFQPVQARHIAPDLIYAAYQGVRAYESEVSNASLQTLHQLRLAAKQLRYTIEFFKEILGEEAREVISLVVEMQDHLGALNDADVAQGMLRKYMRQEAKQARTEQQGVISSIESPSLSGVIAYLEYREQEMQHLLDTFPPIWEKIISPETHQKLALAISVL